jgi:opacity protein-like surface antigen
MRRVCLAALVTALAYAAPVSAQVPQATQNPLFVNAMVGPSFGDTAHSAAGMAAAGYTFHPNLIVLGEVGTFRMAPFDNTFGVTAPPSLFTGSKSAAYHVNANVLYRIPAMNGRVTPYATAGAGTLTATTIENGKLGPTSPQPRERETHTALNAGAGLTYRFNQWLGVGADYRYFVLATDRSPHVNRFTTGVSLFIK